MKPTNLLCSFICLALFTGCSATMLKKVGANSKYAPEGYRDVGVVQYLNKGGDALIAERREDAFKQMHDACNGKYKILREGNKSAMMIESNWDAGYWMIEFQCSEEVAKK